MWNFCNGSQNRSYIFYTVHMKGDIFFLLHKSHITYNYGLYSIDFVVKCTYLALISPTLKCMYRFYSIPWVLWRRRGGGVKWPFQQIFQKWFHKWKMGHTPGLWAITLLDSWIGDALLKLQSRCNISIYNKMQIAILLNCHSFFFHGPTWWSNMHGPIYFLRNNQFTKLLGPALGVNWMWTKRNDHAPRVNVPICLIYVQKGQFWK
jgi:hypothetical protein